NLLVGDTDGEAATIEGDAATNRLASPAVYDTAGNLLSVADQAGATVTFEYDALNRLIRRQRDGETQAWVFAYTADDERIATLELTSGDHRWTLRDSGGLLLREFEYDDADNVYPVRDQIYRGPSLLATVSQDVSGVFGEVAHYSLDHLGTPRLITTDTGEVKSLHKYYPFGEEATLSTQDQHPMKFTGHERDFFAAGESDDLDYVHARYCDPFGGRFLSTDPVLDLRRTIKRPQAWNRYSYTVNNPLKYVDPSGSIFELAGEAELGALRDALTEAGAETFAQNLQYSITDDGIVLDRISNDASDGENELVNLVAEIANSPRQTVRLEFTSRDLGGDGGAATRGDVVLREAVVLINRQQIRGTGVLGTLRVPPLTGRTYIAGVSLSAAIFHELGHAVGQVRRGIPLGGGVAVHYENTFRYLSDDIAFRKSHSPKEAFWVPVK
ncbi:MAG: RHS repeat-associated core domain-containing protein, partial [bacterium]|nr:RHS repeat-associated core domain-containing protein [bacterium]